MREAFILTLPDYLVDGEVNHAEQRDCDNCQSLCCIAYEFTKDDFPEKSLSGVACSKLELFQIRKTGSQGELVKRYRCKIYSERDEKGWGHCETYSCNGAGQMITTFLNDLEIKMQDIKGIDGPSVNPLARHISNLFIDIASYPFRYLPKYAKEGMTESELKKRLEASRFVLEQISKKFVEMYRSGNLEFNRNYWKNRIQLAVFRGEKEEPIVSEAERRALEQRMMDLLKF